MRRGQERAEDAPRRHAGRVHHDDFRIGIEPVERVADRNHQRDRRDDQHQHRDQQAGDADEHQHGLALVGHQVDLAQRVRQPDDRGQADANQQERAERGAENVSVERTHMPAGPPVPRDAASPDAPQQVLRRASMARPGQAPRNRRGAMGYGMRPIFSRFARRKRIFSTQCDMKGPVPWRIPESSALARSRPRPGAFSWFSPTTG